MIWTIFRSYIYEDTHITPYLQEYFSTTGFIKVTWTSPFELSVWCRSILPRLHPRPLSNPSSCQVSVSSQILQVFHQSGQLSVSNPHSEWEKLTELTLWSRITVGCRRCSLPLSSDPLLSAAQCLALSLSGCCCCWSACTGNHAWTAKWCCWARWSRNQVKV